MDEVIQKFADAHILVPIRIPLLHIILDVGIIERKERRAFQIRDITVDRNSCVCCHLLGVGRGIAQSGFIHRMGRQIAYISDGQGQQEDKDDNQFFLHGQVGEEYPTFLYELAEPKNHG
ncbi:hypothetical protein D3C71_1580270 [compost metagenome]